MGKDGWSTISSSRSGPGIDKVWIVDVSKKESYGTKNLYKTIVVVRGHSGWESVNSVVK